MPGSVACRQGSLHPPPWKSAGTAILLAVILAASTLCAQEVSGGAYTHVLVGLDPLTAFRVALDGEAVLMEPVQTDAFGAFGFSIEGREGGTVVVTKPGPLILTGARMCSVSDTGAVVCWYTDRPASSTAEFGLTSDYGLTVGPIGGAVTDHHVPLSPLTAATTYHVRVRSVDASGCEVASDDTTFTTALPDLAIRAVEVAVAAPTCATIRWNTTIASSTMLDYGETTAYGETEGSTTLVEDHEVLLSGLAPTTTYHFRVRAVDSFGQSATSGDHTLGTPPPADTNSPNTPGGLSATPVQGGIIVSWCAIDAPDLAGYGVWRRADGDADFSRIAVVPPGVTSMTDTDVIHGEMLQYAVAAFDHAGNESDLSEPVAAYPGVSGSPRMWVFPNPASSEATIRFTIPRNASRATRGEIGYDVRIYDARGRLVRTVCRGATSAPVVTAHWDTMGADRRIVGSGTYFCVVSLPGREIRSKVMVLR